MWVFSTISSGERRIKKRNFSFLFSLYFYKVVYVHLFRMVKKVKCIKARGKWPAHAFAWLQLCGSVRWGLARCLVPYVRREICSLPSSHLCDHGHSQRPWGFSPSICEMRLAKHCLGSSCESLNQSVYLACEITTVLPVCYYFLFD